MNTIENDFSTVAEHFPEEFGQIHDAPPMAAFLRVRPFLDALAGVGPIETRRLAIISTRHMTRKDDENIRRHAFHGEPLIVSTGRHGSTLLTSGDEQPEWMSTDLWMTLRTLAAAGWQRVELDSDGPVVPGLETFDW